MLTGNNSGLRCVLRLGCHDSRTSSTDAGTRRVIER